MTAALILCFVYLIFAAVIAYMAGYTRGWNARTADKVKLIKEVCPACDGYGHRMDIGTDRVRRDECELCHGRGALDRYVETPQLTWQFSKWKQQK